MKQRIMARPIGTQSSSPRRRMAAVLVVVAVAVVALIAVSGMLAGGATPAPSRSSDVAELPTQAPSRPPEERPSPNPSAVASATPSDAPIATPTNEPTPTPTDPVPSPSPTPASGGAPTSPAEFDLEAQIIDIEFPLRADTRYHYRDNFLDFREGPADKYNHARPQKDGTMQRLHDGIDIYAAVGQPLVATFSGMIVDASRRWQPWEPARYGGTIVIVSDEPATLGYLAMYVHAEDVWVQPGDHVTRGQIVGTVGKTGNAEVQSIDAHLHFELRAPFLLDWSPLGEDRTVDAFNPFSSLEASDPKRT